MSTITGIVDEEEEARWHTLARRLCTAMDADDDEGLFEELSVEADRLLDTSWWPQELEAVREAPRASLRVWTDTVAAFDQQQQHHHPAGGPLLSSRRGQGHGRLPELPPRPLTLALLSTRPLPHLTKGAHRAGGITPLHYVAYSSRPRCCARLLALTRAPNDAGWEEDGEYDERGGGEQKRGQERGISHGRGKGAACREGGSSGQLHHRRL